MTRIAPTVLACLLLAGCSSAPTGASDGSSSAAASQPDHLVTQPPDVGGPTGRPSGAKVRIVNTYVPLTGNPGALDVYPAEWVLEGARPLVSVPYGTASEFFDPTVFDDAGDIALSAYIAGETGNGNEVASQTETLKGGEIITMVVTTGSNEKPNGGRYGGMQVFFHATKGVEFGQPTPAPGKSLLIVSTVGLELIMAKPDDQSLYLKIDGVAGCAKAVGDDQYTLTSVGPGSSTAFQLDPGTYTASIVAQPSSSEGPPSCTGTPLVKDIALTVAGDRTTLLEIYGPKESDIRSLLLPLDK